MDPGGQGAADGANKVAQRRLGQNKPNNAQAEGGNPTYIPVNTNKNRNPEIRNEIRKTGIRI